MKYRAACIIMALCGLSSTVMAQEPDGWKKTDETKDGIVIFARTANDRGIRELKATCMMEAPPKNVWQALLDKETYKESSKYVLIDKVYRTENEDVWYKYQLMAAPMLDKRDCTLKYVSFKNPRKKYYRLIWNAAPDFGPPPEKDVIRLAVCNGYFIIEPHEDGNKSLISYWICVDPGGMVPAWATNIANKSSLPDFLRTVRKQSIFFKEKDQNMKN